MADSTPKSVQAVATVKKYMLGAAGAGLIPIPLADAVALTAIQLKLLHSLAALYDIPFSKDIGKSAIASLLGGGIPVSLSLRLGSVTKTVPVLGWTVGTFGTAAFGGASTYAIGKVFIQHFESGGTFLTFDPNQVRAYYRDQFDNGVEEMRKSFAGIKP